MPLPFAVKLRSFACLNLRIEQENQVTGCILASFNTLVKAILLSLLGLFKLFSTKQTSNFRAEKRDEHA